MSTREHLIQSLKTLCNENGGYKAVADRAGVDDQSLYQIISGVRLPSGNPKGVGPTIQRKLDTAFPGWADMSANTLAGGVREQTPAYGDWPFKRLKPSAIKAISDVQLAAVEEVVGHALTSMLGQAYPAVDWREFARNLAASMDTEIGGQTYSDFVLKLEELVDQHLPKQPAVSKARTN